MRIYSEQELFHFDFWSEAKDNAEQLYKHEFEQLEAILDDCYPDGIDETELNDLFRFEFETVCDWLGLELDEHGNIIRD